MTPQKLYKYRGARLELQLDTLAKDQIWAATPDSLNDPFEATVLVERDHFETLDVLMFGTPRESMGLPRKTEGAFLKFFATLQSFVENARQYGIFSLSQNYLDELSWAHYADSYRGFCIEYQVERLLDRGLRSEVLLPVQYQARPPVLEPATLLSLSNEEAAELMTRALIATKSLRWQHEQEWRVISGRSGLVPLDFRAVRSLYFGYRMPEPLRLRFMERLSGRSLRYFVVEPVPGSYTIQATPLADPYADAPRYLHFAAPIADGVPVIDDYLRQRGLEGLIRRAIEIVRWEPYCERVIDAYEAGSRSSPENPSFYVTCEVSGDFPKNFYLSKQELDEESPEA